VLQLARTGTESAVQGFSTAIARIYDDPPIRRRIRSPGKAAMQSANIEVDRHNVIGVAPARSTSKTPSRISRQRAWRAWQPTPRCVQVEVFRNSANSNSTDVRNALGYVAEHPRLRPEAHDRQLGWYQAVMVMDKCGLEPTECSIPVNIRPPSLQVSTRDAGMVKAGAGIIDVVGTERLF
jgi:hypothetical protein